MNEILELEKQMWEAAKERNSDAFLELVREDAVMVCGGFRCSGKDYAQMIGEFDCSSYEIVDFELVAKSETIKQVHYIITTQVSNPVNADLAGTFHISSTWEKTDDRWKLVFNMDSRIVPME